MRVDNVNPIWPIPLAQIEETVAPHLGPGRIKGNTSAACLSRRVSMYLAKHVGGWSLPKIGRFYNGRHHTTVLHAVAKVERLRRADETFDALIDVLTAALTSEVRYSRPSSRLSRCELIDAVALRVIEHLRSLPLNGGATQPHGAIFADGRPWN